MGNRRLRSVLGVLIGVFLIGAGCQSQENNENKSELNALAQAYKDQFKIGVALNRFQIDGNIPEATSLITKHFNSITPENLLKWERVHPQPDEYNFGPADSYAAFGEQHNMFIVGHTLVWHSQVSDWVFTDEDGDALNREALLQRMKDHISTVVGRYKGRIDGWDVLNEAVLDNGEVRKSKWYELVGEDYVEKAFQYAHEADPDAELYYNDYNLSKPEKREAVIKLVKRLQSKDIPIHGIGMQAHLKIDTPSVEALEESIQAFSDLGLKVMITELDIDLLPREEQVDVEVPEDGEEMPAELNPYTESLPDSMQQKLRERYVALFELFSKHQDKIDRVTFWGLNDGQSWLNNFPIGGRTNYPLLFDREYNPKPAFYGVMDVATDSEQ
ncbi:endo-1,4-beta-xylanase [Aliifodinibius sp. S!AR15-10]|uniref:endo-1,4-beta-xylanase n=1 Tax=Aliifodinibius sp. S!AR15-10 TaxID=2950437 RepID=UPI0028657929|nr:endo-1,4-beta-xylanase [Aliifodinibius sp. S!AR15-10]MDR8394132.1 endo-1,4-beta-xylanase [Aliifodinibius sp. S!AR15-10]